MTIITFILITAEYIYRAHQYEQDMTQGQFFLSKV